jgi:hypothetical protein
LCARDDFEKAEQLDVELQTLQHRLFAVTGTDGFFPFFFFFVFFFFLL